MVVVPLCIRSHSHPRSLCDAITDEILRYATGNWLIYTKRATTLRNLSKIWRHNALLYEWLKIFRQPPVWRTKWAHNCIALFWKQSVFCWIYRKACTIFPKNFYCYFWLFVMKVDGVLENAPATQSGPSALASLLGGHRHAPLWLINRGTLHSPCGLSYGRLVWIESGEKWSGTNTWLYILIHNQNTTCVHCLSTDGQTDTAKHYSP